MAGRVYSFLDFHVSIVGIGLALSLKTGAAEEGIGFEFVDDINTMTIGAGGDGVHSLHATRAGKITVHLLKETPTNLQLAAAYNLQRTSAALHGKNTISAFDTNSGDTYVCQQVAFKRFPPNFYAKDANVITWEFDAIQMDPVLGTLT